MITVGSRVGGYTVIRVLGQGGMGQVFLAQHHRISRRVAVKVLLPELSSNETVIERFFTEARATSLIRHPGIVEVLDCDVLDGQAYIVMEYLEGESLAGYLARTGGLVGDGAFALAVVGQVAVAVGAAHACNIVHRDLKPDNIFLCATARDARVVPKVLDFGIAKVALQGGIAQTRTGAVIGTPTYMSPEQCRGGSKAVDGRSDVYSLGCILYETLCGQPPFVRDGMGDLIVAHVSELPAHPRTLTPDLPPALGDLVMRMLAKSPDDRPPTMDAVAAEIARGLQSSGVRAPLGEITPQRPVIVPAVESFIPLATPPPSGAGAPRSSPSSETVPARPSSTPPPSSLAGGTRVLPDQSRPGSATGGAAGAGGPTTFRGAAGEHGSRHAERPARPSAARWAIPAVAILAIGGLTIVFTISRAKPPEIATAVSSPPLPAPATAPAVAPAPAAPVTVPAAPAVVTVEVRGLPAGAELLLDGAPASGPPMKLRRDDRPHLLVVRAKGYYDRTIEVGADRDRVLDATLTASAGDKPHAHETTRHSSRRTPSSGSPAETPPTATRETDKTTPTKTPPSSGQKKSNYDDM